MSSRTNKDASNRSKNERKRILKEDIAADDTNVIEDDVSKGSSKLKKLKKSPHVNEHHQDICKNAEAMEAVMKSLIIIPQNDQGLASPTKESDNLKCVANLNALIDRYMLDSCNSNFGNKNNRQNVLSLLHQIYERASTVKESGGMSSLETDKLVKFLNSLAGLIERSYPDRKYDAKCPSKDALSASRASLICLIVVTSPQMPKRVYLEEMISTVLRFVEHLVRIVFNIPANAQRQSKDVEMEMMKWSPLNVSEDVKNYKVLQLVQLIGAMLGVQVLPEDMILQLFSLAVSVCFRVNQVPLKQAYLKIIMITFLKYERLTSDLFSIIFDCLSNIPPAKQIVKLLESMSKEHIHPFTELLLEILQGIITVTEIDLNRNSVKSGQSSIAEILTRRYTTAGILAVSFLKGLQDRLESTFEPLDKNLFDTFIRDLLAVLDKPEWPAAELLTRVFGKLLMKNFDGNSNVSLKVTSLDVLGRISAKLRTEAIIAEEISVDDLVKNCYHGAKEAFTSTMGRELDVFGDKEHQLLFIQYILVTYLNSISTSESLKMFYLARWYKNTMNLDESNIEESTSKKKRRSSKSQASSQEKSVSKAVLIKTMIERYQNFHYHPNIRYEDVHLLLRHLASTGRLSQYFDVYLEAILSCLSEEQPSVFKIRAVKALNTIVEADPSVYERSDVESAIRSVIFNSSALLREASLDSVGKFLKARPKSFEKYREVLCDRSLDIAVSVRKMVIRILGDVSSQPDNFAILPEINLHIIRRTKDEESVKKLVADIFFNRWYSVENSLESVASEIVETVASAGQDDLECLVKLQCLVLRGTDNNLDVTVDVKIPPAVLEICKNIIASLAEKFTMCGAEKSLQTTLVYARSLSIFARSAPKLVAKHFATFVDSLRNYDPSSRGTILTEVVKVVDLVLPFIKKIDASEMQELSDITLKLASVLDKEGIQSCLLCLNSLLDVTKNYGPIQERLMKCYEFIKDYEARLERQVVEDADRAQQRQQYFMRMAVTTGNILRYINFPPSDEEFDLSAVVGKIYTLLTRLFNLGNDVVKSCVLTSLGDMSVNFSYCLLAPEVQGIYCSYLNGRDSAAARLKIIILHNIRICLVAEDEKIFRRYLLERKDISNVNLKEMDDSSTSVNALVLQAYLKDVLEAYFDRDLLVRKSASDLIEILIKQALTHPINIVDYIICMGTDMDDDISLCALSQMGEVERKYPGFIHSKLLSGIALSFRLQKLLQNEAAVTRGLIVDKKNKEAQSVNRHLYSMLKNKKQKRALLMSMLRRFEDTDPEVLSYQLYLADNLACFPYSHLDEVLFILHNIDTIVSTVGENLIEDFKNTLVNDDSQNTESEENAGVGYESSIWMMDVDDVGEDFEETLLKTLPVDISPLKHCLQAAQSCWLLLNLKKHLKYVYCINDTKIQGYSPLVADKSYDKVAIAKRDRSFRPDVLGVLEAGVGSSSDDRRQLVSQYINLKRLLMEFDSS